MEVMPGYIQTEVGMIPEDWEVSTLGDLCVTSSGTTPARSLSDRYYRNGSVHWVKTLDLNNSEVIDTDELVTTKAIEETSLRVYPVGTVLVAMYGGFNQIGRTGLLQIPAAVNQAITAVQPRVGKILPEYLLATLNFKVDYWKTVASSSRKDPNITSKDIRAFPLAYPRLSEQQAIAKVLNKADALIETLERLIAKKRLLKKGAMQHLLTEKKRLPGFNKEWETRYLADIAPLQRGFDLPNSKLQQGPYPVVYSNGVLNHHAAFQVKGPGVVTGRSGTIGTVTFVEQNFWPHNTSLWVTTFKDNDPKFIFYLYARIGLERFATGTGVPTLNRNDVHAFKVSVPPTKTEQEAIAEVLSAMDAEVALLEAQLAKYRQLKQGLMQKLLTGRIRLI